MRNYATHFPGVRIPAQLESWIADGKVEDESSRDDKAACFTCGPVTFWIDYHNPSRRWMPHEYRILHDGVVQDFDTAGAALTEFERQVRLSGGILQ